MTAQILDLSAIIAAEEATWRGTVPARTDLAHIESALVATSVADTDRPPAPEDYPSPLLLELAELFRTADAALLAAQVKRDGHAVARLGIERKAIALRLAVAFVAEVLEVTP